MAKIAVVTDSTCDLGPARLAELDVEMVPLKTLFGDETYRDWVDLPPERFYSKLMSSPVHPTTSQPSPQEFTEVYARLADEGAEGIVSIHLSAKLSGTCESASIAAQTSPVPVRVVDSLFVSAAMGLILDDACAARDAGGDLDAVERTALDRIAKTELFFVLETLDYLVKGGRAGRAQGLAASLLNIKPVLQVTGGVIEPFMKEKGTRKAFKRMAEHVAERSKATGRLKIYLFHSIAPEFAEQFAAMLQEAGADGQVDGVYQIGSVIGTHVGPKALGVSYTPMG